MIIIVVLILWRQLKVPPYNIVTLIVTNYTTYLDQCIKSAINPLVVFDGIDPVKGDYHYLQCNASRPSIARNVGLKDIECEFVQFLDSDDYLNNDYYDKVLTYISDDYDLFYTDYNIINEEFNFSHKHYLTSLSDLSSCIFTIKNPLVRLSALKKIKNEPFNSNFRCHEFVDLIKNIGIEKCYHIPYNLQNVRIHAKSHNRSISKEESDQVIRSMGGQTNG